MNAELRHPRLVAHDGATGAGAAGVYRQHGNPVSTRHQPQPQRLNKGAFAYTRHTCEANADCFPRLRNRVRQQGLGFGLVV